MTHLSSVLRFKKLYDLLVQRYPEMADASNIFLSVLPQFNPHQNLELAKAYIGFIARYRISLSRIHFSAAEWELLDQLLIELELELILDLAYAGRNHNQ